MGRPLQYKDAVEQLILDNPWGSAMIFDRSNELDVLCGISAKLQFARARRQDEAPIPTSPTREFRSQTTYRDQETLRWKQLVLNT